MPRRFDQVGSEYQTSTISAMDAASRRAIDSAIGARSSDLMQRTLQLGNLLTMIERRGNAEEEQSIATGETWVVQV